MTITNTAVAGDLTHLFCPPVAVDPVCAECGTAGRLRDHVERKVTDLLIALHLQQHRVPDADLSATLAVVGRATGQDH